MPRCSSVVLCLLPLLAGCAGGEIVGLHIALQADGSAKVTARSLSDTVPPSRAETAGAGVAWDKRAALIYTQGLATPIEALRFGDDSLAIRQFAEAKKITVRLQRGPNPGWVNALVPDRAKRQQLALVYDPSGKTREIADTLRVEIDVGAPVNGSSVLPAARGVEAGREGKRAYLTIPVETAREGGEDLIWDITWQ